MESTNTASSVHQLPPGFPRGDEAATDLVMQLAALQQQQQQQQQHAHSSNGNGDSLHDVTGQSQEEKPGSNRKRRSDGKDIPVKLRKEDENQDTSAAHHQNWASSFTGQEANEFEQLLHQNNEGQDNEDNQSMDNSMHEGAGGISTSDAELLTRHGRPLSTTKRAAQNRAAQRAFRERRDQHVKEVEIKAKQVDQALASAAMHRQRYDELLKTITELRADNSSLRLAISALGGSVPPPPPVSSFPSLDMNHNIDPTSWRGETSFSDTTHHNHHHPHQNAEERGDNHLDGLSAVAAAAAAVATAAANASQDDNAGDKESARM